MRSRDHSKSGQAIIFLMVVVVIGLFVVIWNYDLHRVITAKISTRNAGDAAALAGARWQGITLNMIGDLNLIQAAVLAQANLDQRFRSPFEIPEEIVDLHEMRQRLAFIGPLAAFELAQQAAFQNGAVRDPRVEANLVWLASEFREFQGGPYDGAYDDYADLLESIAAKGAAVSSYSYSLPDHPLTQERFYSAIAQAVAGWWCPMEEFDYELEHYVTYEDWSSLRLELDMYYMLGLKLGEYPSLIPGGRWGARPNAPPATAVPNGWEFRRELGGYINLDEQGIFEAREAPAGMAVGGMYRTDILPDSPEVNWHVFGGAWTGHWPRPTAGKNDFEEDDEDMDRFPLREAIKPEFDYMGAETGIGIAMPVHRGILASDSQETVDLIHRAKAKPFGYVDTDGGPQPPYYYGFVFPVFQEVRLIHSDIGDQLVEGEFFRHVFSHVGNYLDVGSVALDVDCRYCQLIKAWETLDREAGLRWLEDAKENDQDNPCDPDDEAFWDEARGGATGGS